LAGRPGEAFTLTELSEQTDINLSSAHALMNALVESAWLVRDGARKTYQLGPALIAIGQAAVERHDAIRRAADTARALANDLGMEAIVNTVAGEDLLTLAVAGRPEELETRPRVGQRLPFMAPFGLGWLAWDSPEAIDAWVRRACPQPSEGDLESYRRRAAQIRSDGYEVGLESLIRDQIGQILAELARAPGAPDLLDAMHHLVARLAEQEDQHAGGINPELSYDLNYLGAPIFGPDARPVLGIAILGFTNPTSGARLIELADHLVDSTRRVSLATGGRLPLDLSF